MLGWIFKKKAAAPAPAPAPAAATNAPASHRTVAAAQPIDWTARLAQAGSDDALLALLRTAGAPLQVRQAAVGALDSEAALLLAERAFRSHDRRLHQLAKRRLQAKAAQRQTQAQAARLIEAARGLLATADVPVNRTVDLDRAWQALDAAIVEPGQRDAFAALSAQLAALVRERADSELRRKRRHDGLLQRARLLQAACVEAAAGTRDRAALAAAAADARALVAEPAAPDAAADAALDVLRQALVAATALDAHLEAIDALLQHDAETAADPLAPALPALADPQLAALMQAGHARWQQARDQARQERGLQNRALARERQRTRQDDRGAALVEGVAQAETALDAGQLADAERILGAIGGDLPASDATDALRQRIAAAQARLAQLRGWQHWAGGRARDELVLQAEALAAATAASSAGEAAADGTDVAARDGDADAEVARLSIRQRAEVIAALRSGWKEVDRAGGAGSRAQWQRFDAALQAANAPVAAHAAGQRAAREANLAARQQLLDVLEAVRAEPGNAVAGEAAADPHALATALGRFQAEWRKLGPLEHTVPRAASAALVARMEAAVRRVDTPLQAVRQQARAERDALVSRARALAGDGAGRGHDLLAEVRALQEHWQQHARALPLSRADEQLLWTQFKAALDAAFAARDAAFSARDAEFEVHAAERLALTLRLQIRPDDSAAAQRRTLADVDAAWQRCGPAPRVRAAAIDADFRAARAALQRWLDDADGRAWLAGCDALDAKLALCLAREQAAADAAAAAPDLDRAWHALPALPGPLEDALRRRAGLAPASANASTEPAVDALLLQIETAWRLPTPPAFEQQRRERKLLAMKAALEGRRAGAPVDLSPDAAFALLLGRSGLDAEQGARLASVLTAWRARRA